MLIADPPTSWTDNAKTGKISDISPTDNELGINGPDARNAAVYFPRVIKEDLERNGLPDYFPVCGSIAGVMASTDVTRGVWKAPAGQNASIMGIKGLEVNLTDQENGILNPLGINCLRSFPIIGPVVWGARTLRGADQLADDYKYVPVRRLTLYIEESVYRGSQWAVFEPNDEKLWSSLRLSIGGFLADLQRQGAFYNYTVACDSSTTTQSDIDHGIVNIYVGIAPVKPAEFVVIKIQQVAGQKAA
jgi:phage tail sheath protein FI